MDILLAIAALCQADYYKVQLQCQKDLVQCYEAKMASTPPMYTPSPDADDVLALVTCIKEAQ